jgi:hypothetical protein
MGLPLFWFDLAKGKLTLSAIRSNGVTIRFLFGSNVSRDGNRNFSVESWIKWWRDRWAIS